MLVVFEIIFLLSFMGVVNMGGMWKSSFSEFLIDVVLGWCVDEFFNFVDCSEGLNNSIDFVKGDGVIVVGGDYDWIVDLSLFEE